jgi:hypothetical protein
MRSSEIATMVKRQTPSLPSLETPAVRPATFDLNDPVIQAAIAQAVAAAMAAKETAKADVPSKSLSGEIMQDCIVFSA